MKTKVYVERGFDPEKAKTGRVSHDDDHTRRQGLIRPCADAFVLYEYKGERGVLTMYRDDVNPLPNALWIPGGMWQRGVLTPEIAAADNLKRETGLDMTDTEVLSCGSFFWKDSPYDDESKFPDFKKGRQTRKLGEGLHDLGFAVFGRATGQLSLRTLIEPVIIITPKNYDRVMEEHVDSKIGRYGATAEYFKNNVAETLKRL